MAHSGSKRHRDRDQGQRRFDTSEDTVRNRIFRMTEAERQEVARCLRYIDEARRALESQHNPDNREIVRELRASADRVYDLINSLEEMDGSPLPSVPPDQVL